MTQGSGVLEIKFLLFTILPIYTHGPLEDMANTTTGSQFLIGGAIAILLRIIGILLKIILNAGAIVVVNLLVATLKQVYVRLNLRIRFLFPL